jgi:UDP-GlcNAc:undecaprenyl-phosphate GlcNAc-1-phosphate transferase
MSTQVVHHILQTRNTPVEHNYWLAFIIAFAVAALLTPLIRKIALYIGATSVPGGRHIHTRVIARLGGVAIALAFILVVAFNFPITRHLLGLFGGIAILLTVGILDDIHSIDAWKKLVWQVIAACVALAGGIGITTLTNPFGGTIFLDWGRFAIHFGTWQFHISPVANLLSILWMVGLINVVNFLDGLDGLACGVSGIAALTMFFVSLSPRIGEPEVALLAIILAGAAFGFLPFNFFPARIFMGDSGAYFLGITLAMLAIYSGAKLATAALVLGFTIVDGLWAVIRRLYNHTSPFTADKGHLHHLLLDVGFSQRKAVLLLYFVSAASGLVALYAGTIGKIIAFVILVCSTALGLALLLAIRQRRGIEF